MIDMQVCAHHHVDLVRLDARRRQTLEIPGLHHVPLRPIGARLVIADTGVDQDTLAADLDQPAMDAELQEARGFVIVIGQEPVAMLAHDIGVPGRKELLGLEVELVALLDTGDDGATQLQFDHCFPFWLRRRA
ncbi:MAG TPA: hypothetical protein VH499_01265 [Reyranella sp.]|jgi:hypothetical protein